MLLIQGIIIGLGIGLMVHMILYENQEDEEE